jgi:threonine dehydratase
MPPPALQVQSPLDTATKLSEALGNTVLLKREDLQPVRGGRLEGGLAGCERSESNRIDMH